MRGAVPPGAVWGKLDRDDNGAVSQWHPLIAHCADVAACCLALLGWRPDGTLAPCPLRQRLARLAGQRDLTRQQVERLAVITALHDLGKANRGFQCKRFPHHPLAAGHVAEALALLFARGTWGPQATAAILLESLDTWVREDGIDGLLFAALCHHGKPVGHPDWTIERIADLWAPGPDHDPIAAIAALRDATQAWLPGAWSGGGQALDATPAFQHDFCGLVQLADWLGSDRTLFPFAEDDDHWPRACAQAQAAMLATGLDLSAAHAALGPDPDFARLSPYPPRPMQQAVGALPQPDGPSLTLIEEETGGGKTEAALWHWARLCAAGAVDGLYLALPTRTAATQVYARVRQARDRCFPHGATPPPVILAVPGYLHADGAEGRRLEDFTVLWNDDPADALRHRRWAAESPKRSLAGALVVGTIDQALLAALTVGHAHLRGTCLLRQLLVIDEVHASDPYMTRLTGELLRHQRAAGGHALLMSATLGSAARDRLFAAWHGRPGRTALDDATRLPYPALWPGPVPQSVPRTGRDRRVALRTAGADDPQTAAEAAIAAARDGARVLIIRNLRRDCLATQERLEALAPDLLWRVDSPAGPVPAPHHARYARADRTHLDQALERSFGKDAPRTAGLIACATTTVQQALDLDCDLMITDLAPVDVLLQRLGRLHRHGHHPRPPGYATPTAVILMPADGLGRWLGNPTRGPHGWGGIYTDLRVLEATRRLVQEGAWDIPADNRRLVEAATHPQALAALQPDEPAWEAHGARVQGAAFAQQEQARLCLLRRDLPFTDTSPGVLFPQVEERVSTRLGEGDRRLLWTTPVGSPFGHPITEMTVPPYWCRTVADDAEAAAPAVGIDHLRLRLGAACFRYDRLGLRPEDAHA